MGVVECRHRHVGESGLALLNHASLPHNFWRYAFAATVFTYKWTTTTSLADNSPFEELFRWAPNIRDLRVFGCLAYSNLWPFTRIKFTNRLSPHIFLRYPDNVNRYHCYNPITEKMIISRDVVFIEDNFSENLKLSGRPNSSPEQLEDPSPKSLPIGILSRSP